MKIKSNLYSTYMHKMHNHPKFWQFQKKQSKSSIIFTCICLNSKRFWILFLKDLSIIFVKISNFSRKIYRLQLFVKKIQTWEKFLHSRKEKLFRKVNAKKNGTHCKHSKEVTSTIILMLVTTKSNKQLKKD